MKTIKAKIVLWFRRVRLSKNERMLMAIGLQCTEEYINSRQFRRKIRKTLTNETLENILGTWEDDKN